MKENENTFVINIQTNVDKQALADIEKLAENLEAIQRAGRHPNDATCAKLIRGLVSGDIKSEHLNVYGFGILMSLANRLEGK